MPKRYRLTGEEIRNLSGKRLYGRLFSLLVAPAPGDHAKCAVVVSKKVAADAVGRNLIKRRCRAALAGRISRLGKPLALVFGARREAADASFAEIARDVETLLARL